MNKYLQSLAAFGISSAHPGGFSLTKKLVEIIGDLKGKRILDAGCGTGQTAAFLAKECEAQVTAIDLDPLMIEKATQRAKAEKASISLFQGDIANLPFPDNSFDLVLTESVTVFADIEKTLKEFGRVLVNNGQLFAVEMTREPSLTQDEVARVQSFYGIQILPNEMEWRTYLEKAGFVSIKLIGSENLPSEQEETPTEFQLSTQISTEFFDVLYEHEAIMHEMHPRLNYRIISAHSAK